MSSQTSSSEVHPPASLQLSEKYDSWSREELIARLNELEAQLPSSAHTPLNTSSGSLRQPSPPRPVSSTPDHISGSLFSPHSPHIPSPPAVTTSTSATTSTSTASVTATTSTQPHPKPKYTAPPAATTKPPKKFTFTSHPTLKIALKFSYHGSFYNGLAYQLTPTPLPTVEQVLFDALAKAKLVDAEGGFEGCGWERCGRTDRGVSAAGQVVSVWVRAGKVAVGGSGEGGEGVLMGREAVDDVRKREEVKGNSDTLDGAEEPDAATPSSSSTDPVQEPTSTSASTSLPQPTPDSLPSIPVKPLRYMKTLNRLLPPTIRIHAWSPVDTDFSARFNCQYRHYKYFFTNSSFDIFPSPSSSSTTSTPPHETTSTDATTNEPPIPHGIELDIERMQQAAQRLVGTHDFRNLCKLDAGKQIEVFERTILSASVAPLSSAFTSSPGPPSASSPSTSTTPSTQPTPSAPSASAPSATSAVVAPENTNGLGMYVFDLVGTAFLYHQVRHIMAILFLIGTGLESPELVTRLLHSTPSSPDAPSTSSSRDAPSTSSAQNASVAVGEAGEPEWEVVDRKPEYQMADGLPLMLWDCAYKEGDVRWRTDEDERLPVKGGKGGKAGMEKEEEDSHGLHNQMASALERSIVNSTLEAHFLLAAMRFPFNRPAPSPFPLTSRPHPHTQSSSPSQSQPHAEGVKDTLKKMVEEGVMMNLPLGGGTYRRAGKYVPVLERKRLDSVEVANERWRVGKGMRRMERRRGGGVAGEEGGEE